jgi:hypothetical protein
MIPTETAIKVADRYMEKTSNQVGVYRLLSLVEVAK